MELLSWSYSKVIDRFTLQFDLWYSRLSFFFPYVSSLGINDVLQEEQSDDAEILSPHGVFA